MNAIQPIHVASTVGKQAEPGRFRAALRAAASGIARGLAATVDLAAPFVPGGAVLSAAVRSAAGSATGLGRVSSSPANGATGVTGSGGRSTPAGDKGDGETDVLGATRALQKEAHTFNLQYIQLQESMQRESREFTTLSNVMKVKHDTAKAAIDNIH